MTGPVEKHVEGARLLTCYGALLTPAQRALMDLYYDEDLSLHEIAEQQGISRQGVHDILTRSLRKLEGYEARLGLVQRGSERLEALARCLELAKRLPDGQDAEALRAALDRLIQEEEQS